jgi:hypothetical protein
MEDNGKYTGRTSKFWGVICALIFLLYIFHSQIGNLIINSPIGSSICKNIKVFSGCCKINRFPQIKRNGPLMSPHQQRMEEYFQSL